MPRVVLLVAVWRQACIDSEPGQDAKVCLSLSRYEGAVDVFEPPADRQRARLSSGQTLLVVADEPSMRLIVHDAPLRSGGSRTPTGARPRDHVERSAICVFPTDNRVEFIYRVRSSGSQASMHFCPFFQGALLALNGRGSSTRRVTWVDRLRGY